MQNNDQQNPRDKTSRKILIRLKWHAFSSLLAPVPFNNHKSIILKADGHE